MEIVQQREDMKKPDTSHIRCILAVHSGKGGVGKTTLAVHIAALLARTHIVGLLDADIDCPDVGRALGIRTRVSIEGGKMVPVEAQGMKVMSSAFLADDEPIIVRGPMKHSFLMQMLEKTQWGHLDYLVIDLPPGTSDVQLSTLQYIRPQMIFVTTPSVSAVDDTRRSILMAQKFTISTLGVVENMTGDVFGSGGAQRLAEETGTEFLGKIALDRAIASLVERGALAEGETAQAFEALVEKIRKKTQ